MSVNISKLKRKNKFENEKIKISFMPGEISNDLSVYIKDENGKSHHILWEISPDRCLQNFDKTNEKIKVFVESKITEWVNDYEESERLRKEAMQNESNNKDIELKKLMESF